MGFTCNYPEKPETLLRDLRELGPTIALAPPRFWENTLTAVMVRAGDASRTKRRLFNLFRHVAEQAEMHRGAGRGVPAGLRLGLASGEVLVYGPLRDQLGLRRARWVYTGGAPLGADTFRFFRAVGVNLKQVYGATELAGLCSAQANDEVDPDTVGRAFQGTELRIADNGEVQVRSESVFQGYYKQEEATRAAMTEDGWLKTGDAGFIDRRGHLVIIDRARDVGKLADGTAFAPQFIENKLKFSPYIGEAIAFGDARPVRRRDRRDRPDNRGQLGRAAQSRLYLVPGSVRQARGYRPGSRGDPQVQRDVARGDANPPLPGAQQGV